MVICLQCSKYKLTVRSTRIYTGIYTNTAGNEIRSPVSHSHSLSFHVTVVTFGLHAIKSTTKGF